MLVSHALIEINYPSECENFLEDVSTIAALDVYNGGEIIDHLFTFSN